MPRRPGIHHLLFLLIVTLLFLDHLIAFHTKGMVLHLNELVYWWHTQPWWPGSCIIRDTGVSFGGPLYAWMSFPALLFANPAAGVSMTYLLWELLALTVWFFCPTEPLLSRQARMTAAIPLVLFGELRVNLCENSTLMGIVIIPVFITFVWALCSPRPRRMALPGVLLGVAIQIHVLAVAVLPAFLWALLQGRPHWLRQAKFLGLGLCVAFAFSLPEMFFPAPMPEQGLDLSHSTPLLAMLQNITNRLTNAACYPLVLMGSLLTVLAWNKAEVSTLGRRFALVWFVLGVLLFGAAFFAHDPEPGISLRGIEFAWKSPRFAPLNPARAVLTAVVALWLYSRARSLLKGRGPGLLTINVFFCLLAAGWLWAQAAEASKSNTPISEKQIYSKNLYQLFEFLRRSPLPLSLQMATEKHSYWRKRLIVWRIWNGLPRLPESGDTAGIFTPQLPGVDLSRLPGARRIHNTVWVPGCIVKEVGHLRAGEVRPLGLGPSVRRGRLLVGVTASSPLAISYRAVSGERAYHLPLVSSTRYELKSTGFSLPHSHTQWSLFELGRIVPSSTTLELKGSISGQKTAELQQAKVFTVLLPAAD